MSQWKWWAWFWQLFTKRPDLFGIWLWWTGNGVRRSEPVGWSPFASYFCLMSPFLVHHCCPSSWLLPVSMQPHPLASARAAECSKEHALACTARLNCHCAVGVLCSFVTCLPFIFPTHVSLCPSSRWVRSGLWLAALCKPVWSLLPRIALVTGRMLPPSSPSGLFISLLSISLFPICPCSSSSCVWQQEFSFF